MFNKIKEKIIFRKQTHYYQHQFLYVCSTTKKETLKDTKFQYQHYEIILTNNSYLVLTTKVKILTGEDPNTIHKYKHRDFLPYILTDKNTETTYTIHCNLAEWLYNQNIITCPNELSIEKLKHIVNKENEKNYHNAYIDKRKSDKLTKQAAIRYKTEQEKTKNMLEREFGKQ